MHLYKIQLLKQKEIQQINLKQFEARCCALLALKDTVGTHPGCHKMKVTLLGLQLLLRTGVGGMEA